MDDVLRIEQTGWTFDALPAALSRWNVEPRGIVHIGAHRGEEVPVYRRCGFGSIALVEPDPRNAQICALQPDVTVVEAAVASERGTATLYVPTDTRFAGLQRNPAKPAARTIAVSTLPACDVQGDANVMVVDTQGTELDVLSTADLDRLDLVIVETAQTSGPVYAARYDVLVEWMRSRDWRMAEVWAHEAIYADTLFVPESRRG